MYNILSAWLVLLLTKMVLYVQAFYFNTCHLWCHRKTSVVFSLCLTYTGLQLNSNAIWESPHHTLNPYERIWIHMNLQRIENLELHLETVYSWRSAWRYSCWPTSIIRMLLLFLLPQLSKYTISKMSLLFTKATLKIAWWEQLAAHTGGHKPPTRSRSADEAALDQQPTLSWEKSFRKGCV